MALSLLPSAALATDGTGSAEPAAPSTEGTTTETSFVCGGCVIEFSENGADPETYTATVRALTPEEAANNNVDKSKLGKLDGTGNSWDGNGDWASAGENKNVAPYWKTYKDVTTKVVIKSGVISLGGAAFTRFDKVTSLVWDGDPTVTEINNNFLMCSSINELTIPATVQSIGGYAFGKYHNTGTAPTKVTLQNPSVICNDGSFAYQDKDQVLIEVNTSDDISDLLAYAETNGYRVKNLADCGEGTENGISWAYSSGVLSLSGRGAMKDYSAEDPAPWSEHMGKIATVSIADGITSIGANAFKGAMNLTSIRFPQSVTSIGDSAFEGTGLTGKVRVPATVSAIGNDAFKGISAAVYIYNGIWNHDGQTNLIDDTKIGTEKIVHYIYGANIGGSTYPRTTNVLLGVAEDGTAYVDAYSNGIVGGFDWDGGYHYVEVAPDNDLNRNDDMSIVSPLYIKSTKTVWPHSGDVNPRVKKVVIGDNVVSLSTGLFAYCSNLTELQIRGQHLTTIGNNVFMGTSIENVNLPATVTSIGAYAFGQYGGIGKNPLSITLNCEKTQIKFNGKTEETEGEPFSKLVFSSADLSNPQSILLRAHGSTNAQAYANSVGYTFVDLDAKGAQIGSTNTYWSIKNGNTLLIYGNGTTGDFTADEAKPWAKETGITKIEVAAGVTTVGKYLFSGMNTVTDVSINNGVETISEYAFYDLPALKSVALPSSVSSVGEYAFALSAESTEAFAFGVANANAAIATTATNNRNATMDQPTANGSCGKGNDGSYRDNVVYKLDADGTLTLTGSGVIGEFAWDGRYQPWKDFRDQIKKVVIGEGITTIGSGAFAYCKKIESVKLPTSSLTSIGGNAFMDAGTKNAFANFTVPESVTKVGSYAFGYYQENADAKLSGITLGNPNTEITKSSFNGNSNTPNSTVTIYVRNNGGNCTVKTQAAAFGYKYIDLDVYYSADLTASNLKYELYDGILTLTAIDPEKEATIPSEQPWANKAGEITKIVIGSGVREIPANAFKDYTALKEIELPMTLRTICSSAFAVTAANDTELTVTIPKSVTDLAGNAFDNRSNVKMTVYANTGGANFYASGVTKTVKKEFKVLLIGNSYSEDASDWNSSMISQSYKIFKSLMGNDVELEIGLMASGGKALAWHATNAFTNEAKYSLRLAGEDGKWTTDRSVSTIKDALAYDEWDVVSLQPYGEETTSGTAGNNQGDYAFDEDRFGKLEQSIPYFLDLTETYVPHAKVYYYMHLSEHNTTNYADALTNTADKYTKRASVAQMVMNYYGTVNTSKRLAGVVPVGTAIQNARTTYLTTLSNATSSSAVTLENDPVFGLQRDGGHLSFNVGRYIAALTFAEKIIPASFRNGQIDCGMRASESVGKLPAQYEEIARKAVDAAIKTPYQLTTISGYETDPIGAIKTAAESTYEESAWASEAAFKAAVETKIADFAGAKVESVAFSDGTATVELRYGYSTATAEITYSPDAVAAQWTAYIESTKLGSTTVPGSDKKYSEAPDIQKAMTDGYSAILAATTADAATKALEDSKTALLNAVKDYVKFLADTVYKNGEATVIGDKSYTVSESDYRTAITAITGAENVSGVLSAYDTMLTKQVTKTIPTVTITANKATMTGSGTVKLTVNAPAGVKVEVTCDDASITVKDNGDGTFSAYLPNATKDYTFTLNTEENGNYTAATASCPVSVTRRSSSAANPGSTVSVPSTPNGTVTVTPSNASKGTNVTVTVKPSEGYELGSIEVLDKNGDSLKLKDLGNGKYSFVMPDGKVSVEAEFVKTAATSFADVPANAYFADAVKWAVDKGITNGLSDTMFGPYESCTRAQIVTFLWRAAGSPEPKTASSFTDVSASAYYAKAVAWAIENGITNGMTETTFAPNATCTRGQSVTFLHRALKGTASGSTNFTDVKSDAFYADAINWAVANNVTNGTSNTTFSPNADCTRAEIVTFLYRAYQGK